MLQWMDNFHAYGSNPNYLVQGLYAQAGPEVFPGTVDDISLVVDPDPIYSDRVLRFDENPYGGSGSYTILRKNLDDPDRTVGVAERIRLTSLPSSNGYGPYPVIWCNSSNSILAALRVNTDGSLSVRSGSLYGTTLATSAPNTVVAGSWIHLEAELHMDAAAGTIEVRVEGVPVIEVSGLALSDTDIGIIQIGLDPTSTSSAEAYYIKDLIIWNGAGTENNDFVGSCTVVDCIPDADNSLGGWLTSTGSTGYDLIDEAPPNDDTDYIYADDTPPAACSFDMSDLPADVTSVRGLMSLVRATKTDGGDGNLQVGLISNGSTGLGTDHAIGSSYTFYYDFFETDPDTGAAWLPGAVDAAVIQLDRTT